MSLGSKPPSAASLLQLDEPNSDDDVQMISHTTSADARRGTPSPSPSPSPTASPPVVPAAADGSAAPPTKSKKAKKKRKSPPADTIDLRDDEEKGAANTSAAAAAPSAAATTTARPAKVRRTATPPTTETLPAAAAAASSSSTAVAAAAAPASSADDDLATVQPASSVPATPAPAPRSSLGFESMGGEGEGPTPGGSKKHEKKSARRYFDGEDITTRCYNCGRVGHISTECTNATVFKPCWLCGLRGHPAFRCTRELCFRCLKEGHQSRECTNPKLVLKCCFFCGSSHHAHTECRSNGSGVDLSSVRCYVCGERGHLNCSIASSPSPLVSVASCSNCGVSGHIESACLEDRMPSSLNVDNYGNVWEGSGPPPSGGKNNASRTPRKDWKADMECFYCGEKGHMKSDCPKKQGDFQKWGHAGFGRGSGQFRSHHNTPNHQRQSSASPHHRQSPRDFDRSPHHSRNNNGYSRDQSRERDRDRDFLDRSYDRRRSGGGHANSHHHAAGGREGRSHERTERHHRDSRSAPPSKSRDYSRR